MRQIVALSLILLLASFALAQDTESVVIAGVADNTSLTGFVDASTFGDVNQGSLDFGFDQAEIDVIRTIQDNAILRVDLEWVRSGAGYFANVEQGFMNVALPMLPQVEFTLGKFNAPIGFELLDPTDMYQYSHSLVFDYCLPTNLTGLMASGRVNKLVDLRGYVTNGWDLNTDNNRVLTAGGRAGLQFDWIGVGLSAIRGVSTQDQNTLRSVYDVDITLTPSDRLVCGGELNLGSMSYDHSIMPDHSWTGFMVMAHYDFLSWMGVTGRFDSVSDPDAIVFTPIPGGGYTRSSITLAPTFVLGPGLGALCEFRMDMASKDVFTDRDNNATNSSLSVAFEMTYTF